MLYHVYVMEFELRYVANKVAIELHSKLKAFYSSYAFDKITENVL